MMKLKEFIKNELRGWGKYENIIFPLEIILIIILSIIMNDSKVALISAICGICYTILAGKGKISCYFFGLASTLCYVFISYKNHLFGNVILNLCYYLPLQIIGIFKWKKHLQNDTQTIKKTKLANKQRLLYIIAAIVLTVICYVVLIKCNDQNPLFDALTSILSVFGLLLTVKRCVEQWYIWFVVNGLSTIMWIEAYYNGSNCFSTVIMWATYFVLSIYFLKIWQKDLSKQKLRE